MRSSNRFICICVLAGLAVVLAGVSTARADVVWSAPDVTITSPAAPTVLPGYTLTIGTNGLNGPDAVNGYNFLVTLSGPAGVTFGPAVQASSNYVLGGLAGVAGYNGTSAPASISGTDGANATAGNQTVLVMGSPKNLVTIPINVAAGAVGVWTVTWDASGFQTNSFDFEGMEPAGGYQYHNGTIQINPDEPPVIPAPMAVWGGMALFGFMGLRSWRRRQA